MIQTSDLAGLQDHLNQCFSCKMAKISTCFMIMIAGDDFPQLLLDRRLLRARFRLKLLVVLLPEHFLSIRF